MKATISVGRAAAILSAVAVIAAAAVNAQQRMSPSVAPRVTALRSRPAAAHVGGARTPAARRTASAAPGSSVHFNAATNSFEWSNGTPVSLQQLLNAVPGLGFDYHHLSVINQDLGIKALIDPATEWKIAEARRVLHGSRFSGPGFYILDGGAYYPAGDDPSDAAAQPADSDQSGPPQPQPQVIVVEAPPSQQADDNSSTPEQSEEQIPDVGQFTLVLRNGRQLEAVAFSHVNDEIVYITTDGSRRSFPATDLNSDATVQINVERGTPLQLPL
jgi:hypothetical protein